MIGLPERNELVAKFLVDCFNTLTLIFPPLYFPCLREQKSELSIRFFLVFFALSVFLHYSLTW